ncbi:MAG: sulfatase-like hydrolase/transferase [Polyangiaceae bacterium]
MTTALGQLRRLPVLALCALAVACTSCDEDEPDSTLTPTSSGAVGGASSDAPQPRRTSLVSLLSRCDLYHRGAFIDLAGKDVQARREFDIGPFVDTQSVDREGTQVARIDTKKLAYDFWLDADLEEPFVELRGAAGSVSRAGIYLDDRYVATVKLGEDIENVRTRSLDTTIGPGRHTVTLNLRGKSSPQGRIDVDWIRLAATDDIKATFTPLREEDIVRDIAIDGVPRHALTLPAPSAVRCPLWVPSGAAFNVNLGFWGTGKGDAELRLLEDGKQPLVLQRRKLHGGPGSSWTPVHIDLKDYADRLVAIELRAASGVDSGRLVFGDPELQLAPVEVKQHTPTTNTVVLILLSGIDRRRVPPFSPPRDMPALAELMRAGVTYTGYRTPTTVSSAVVASVLTGVSPRAHGLQDPYGSIPEDMRSVAEVLKQASGRTAMFTGVPTSFAGFGFDRGWDRFEEYSPVKDLPASEPLLKANEWLEKQLDSKGRRLVVAHLRGGHPPWDLTTAEAGQLPPSEYGGLLRARRGAIILHDVRARRRASSRRLASEDWQRLHAFHDAALIKQDAELSKLLAMLKKKGAYDDALIIVAGDVPMGDPPEVPFDPAPPLREDRLLAPLYVKFPHGELSGSQVSLPTTAMDIATTILAAFDLKPARRLDGIDLYQSAVGVEPPLGRPLEASLGNDYSSRWGLLLLSGRLGRKPELCELDVDPACVSDAFESRPIAARALWRATHKLELEARRVAKTGRRANLSPDETAALTVWGY